MQGQDTYQNTDIMKAAMSAGLEDKALQAREVRLRKFHVPKRPNFQLHTHHTPSSIVMPE